MKIGFLFTFLTNPFVALMAVLLLFLMGMILYGETANKKNKQYSSFLYEYAHGSLASFLNNCVVVLGAIAFFGCLILMLVFLEKGAPNQMGVGAYFYVPGLLLALVFFTNAERAERKDIRGHQKQMVKRLMSQAEVQMKGLEHYAKYHGKSALVVQRINASLQKVMADLKSEKRLLKNKKNIYRSLERMVVSEVELAKAMEQIVEFQSGIEKLYDQLYELEAVLINKRYEEERKKLNIAKEHLKEDPYAAVQLLNGFQYMYALTEKVN